MTSQQYSIKKGKESEKKENGSQDSILLLVLVLLVHFYMESSQLNRD